MASLEALGYTPLLAAELELLGDSRLCPARVVADGARQYALAGVNATHGELSGKLRGKARPRSFPVTGDWVAVEEHGASATIHHVLDRKTVFERRAAGRGGAAQVIVANVDVFFIVTSANRDLNPRRLERYLTQVIDGGASPVIVLNKVDLVADPAPLLERIREVSVVAPVVCTSGLRSDGLDALREHLGATTTIGFIGSSGVGKSTLVNALMGDESHETQAIRSDGKGRHTTTRRELLVLPGGGVLIDTPGLREVGLVGDAGGLDATFPELSAAAAGCRFRDCSHEDEPGCAVHAAIERGEVSPERLESYHALRREVAAAERRRDPVQRNNAKKRWKSINKEMRQRYKRGLVKGS